jgi:glycosyltransferase involved in cell wall biosynthesis
VDGVQDAGGRLGESGKRCGERPNMSNSLSCVIRTYNEAEFIGPLIEKLQAQAAAQLEIIVVDSSSTDSTPHIAETLGAKLLAMPRKEFNYSKALNMGIEKSGGDIILIVSAHVLPREDNWLATMTSNFSDSRVAGVYCRQVPRPDANWREIVRLDKQFGTDSIRFANENRFEELYFSNAASCVRKSVWQKHPFVVMPAAEDREWARWAIQNSYTLIYEAGVSVYHSHQETPRQAAQRQIAIEKAADMRLDRKRSRLLTAKQACGLSLREIKEIFSLGCCEGKRIGSCMETFAKAFWYAVDFND